MTLLAIRVPKFAGRAYSDIKLSLVEYFLQFTICIFPSSSTPGFKAHSSLTRKAFRFGESKVEFSILIYVNVFSDIKN